MKRNKNRLTSKLAVLGLVLIIGLGSMTIGTAAWTDEILFSGTATTGSWCTEQEGSPGFWKNVEKTHKYTCRQLLDFCATVDAGSRWLIPDLACHYGIIDWVDVLKVIDDGEGGTARQKFLRQYICLRLNVTAGRLFLTTTHHIYSNDPVNPYHFDPGNYLGLTPSPSSPPVTLQQIINAIEDKYLGASPTGAQYTIMQKLCEALNTLLV
ncbi:MAG: hypothetical protein P3T54_07895 [Dehalogenimonas sp.]|uniref:SLH domain-containing protein n=1 Tax=Candidatus Dehalogenimonas loeffleri TaxID=3127115 RepID=A0ABZ2J8V8_9CHLR|nr:hypothetical protein [Dehalogenimonas sp.]